MTEIIQIESPQAVINRARFAGKDFFTIVDDLVARIQLNFATEFNDFVSSGLGQMLIDMVAWAGETMSFYLDRQASESYLETARTRRAVNRLARQLGYKMVPATAATVDLEVNLAAVWGFDVTIPVGFQFQGPNDLVFEAVQSVTFPAGEGPLSPARTVSCREGVTVTENFRSSGLKNQAFRLNPGEGRYIASGTMSVLVGVAPWTESEFITYDKTNQYETDYNAEPPLLRFGDGVAGNIPAAGADIRATYTATSGLGGLVTSGTITDVARPLVVAFNTIDLTITNPEGSSGGADRESLTETKRRVPFFFKARNVAVTQEDYIGLSQAYSDPIAGTVAVAQAFTAHSAADDVQLSILLDNIRAITLPLVTNVEALTDSARTDLAALDAAQVAADAANTDVGTELGNIATASGTARTAAVSARDVANHAEALAASCNTLVTGITGGALSSALTNTDKNQILQFLTDIDSDTVSIKTGVDDVLTELGNIDVAEASGATAQGDVATQLAAMTPLLANLSDIMDDIDVAVGTGFEAAIEDNLVAIYAHVDGFLADGCKANLVQVPIAAKDVDGFLVPPSAALVNSLQAYLVARKEVTQVVEVVSGESFLVRAIITGTVGVLSGYVHASVLSEVENYLDDLLRDRAFGASLRLSDLYTATVLDPLKAIGGIPGVKYAVFRITGPSDHLDGDGNLIVSAQEVITKGSITLLSEVASS